MKNPIPTGAAGAAMRLPSAADPEPGPERVHALCDGVVSIALTVLALEIRVPEGHERPLAALLEAMVPQALAFLLSFVVIGGFWLAHHRLTRQVHRTSRGYNLANVGFMLALVALNVPTAILAHYADREALAVVLYAGVVAAAGALLLLTVAIAHRQQLVDPPADRAQQRAALAVVAWPTLVFLASIPVAAVDPLAAMLGWTLAALGPLARRLAQRRAAPAAA